jgi:uncharacterized membrane protein YjgN (DUF898 family)
MDWGTTGTTSRLARELEDGPLRRELLGRPPPPPAQRPPEFETRLAFHGRGSEYFRIWVVNLLLTLLTLGLYSPWAKVRKLRWFAQHTALMGDRFDFHGDPWRILLGRAVAVGLLVLWSWSFDIALWLGGAVLVLFCIVGPLLFASAQRFRLANTSWRGLRFGFDVPRRRVYLVCVPMLLLWTLGSVLQAAGVTGGWIVGAGLATLVGLPWAHARLKQLQHEHANFGAQRFSFEPAAPEFYYLYAAAVALAVVGAALAAPIVVLGVRESTQGGEPPPVLIPLVVGAAASLLAWLLAWPYFAARMQQVVWSHTRCGGVRFRGEMKGGRLWRLVLGQTALVLLTAGLYWPFAAVAIARYRVQAIVVEADAPVGEIVALAHPAGSAQASGDAAADFFGLDLGW